MSWLLKTAVNLTGWRERQRLNRSCQSPRHAQLNLLDKWIRENGHTRFGRDHRFSSIRNLDDFRMQVPIRDYEGIRPYVDAIIAGGRDVLTRCPPFMFNMTSGTTGSPKYVPWNASSDAAGSRLMRQWIYRTMEDHPGVLDHHALCMVSPAVEGYAENGLPVGSASGRIYQRIPAVVRRHYAIPYAVSKIKDYDQRYFAAMRLSIAKRVSIVSTPNPSTLVRLAETGSEHQEKLIRAVCDGNLGAELAEQPDIQRELERSLKPDPLAARSLEKLSRADGALYPKHYWPDLKLIGCWTGGSVGAQLDKLPYYFGTNVPVRDLGYLASEGRMSLPVTDHTSSGVLAINTNFYEFIHEDEIDNPGGTLLCDELETGKRYHVILTTAGGLYRYDINDVIEITGWHGNAPLISFVRKGGDMTNITGEKMHVNHCLATMNRVADDLKLEISQYRFVADDAASVYHVLVELGKSPPTPATCSALSLAIDRNLGSLNIEYEQKRRSGRLSPPRVHIMPAGWSAAERRAAVNNGRRDVEFKWRHLVPVDQCKDSFDKGGWGFGWGRSEAPPVRPTRPSVIGDKVTWLSEEHC